MAQLNAYLIFNGTCREAMRFYETALGAKLEMLMTHAEAPSAPHMPPGSADLIMHARLVKDGEIFLMASDGMPGQPYEGMKNFSLSLIFPTVAEAQKIFDVLATDGRVTMPFQKTFWAAGFGMLVDRFGTPWMLNSELA